jgi:hypothetical protein
MDDDPPYAGARHGEMTPEVQVLYLPLPSFLFNAPGLTASRSWTRGLARQIESGFDPRAFDDRADLLAWFEAVLPEHIAELANAGDASGLTSAQVSYDRYFLVERRAPAAEAFAVGLAQSACETIAELALPNTLDEIERALLLGGFQTAASLITEGR